MATIGTYLANRFLVESFIPGNYQANGKSSAAIVVLCTLHADQFCGDRVHRVETHDRGSQLPQWPPKVGIRS